MVAGYTNAACIIYDIETGKSIVRMETLQVSVNFIFDSSLVPLILKVDFNALGDIFIVWTAFITYRMAQVTLVQ